MQNASAFRAIASLSDFVHLGVIGGMNTETGGVRDVVVIAFTERAGE
ncbi:hypothetical protein [Amphritea sp.]